jgi:serine protease Do
MPFAEKMKQQRLLSVALLFLTLALGIIIGTLVNTGVKADKQTAVSNAPGAAPLVIPQAVPISNEFTKLAKRLEPSVVYIESDYLPKAGKRPNPNLPDEEDNSDSGDQGSPHSQDPSDLFKRFFGKQEPRSFRKEGSGTGFIVDKNGYILTNHHVVEKADRIRVKLSGDDGEYRGKVIGYDAETDLAVLKIEAKHPLNPVQIGNSDSVVVGDWAVAIGSPFGLQATVTAGIVSATGRDLPTSQPFQHFLQTDAAINPGNSGGPLLNIRGEVIGINTMIATTSGSYEGIGFALPSNMAVRVYNDIIRQGRVVRGSIGVVWSKGGSQVDTLEAFGLSHGVLVESVSRGGPAARAGIQADDVILALNDRPVKDGEDLITKVADLPIGSTGLFTVDRNGKRMDFKVNIEERSSVWKDRPEFAGARPGPSDGPQTQNPSQGKFGITITRLSDKERGDLGIDEKVGVKIVSVDSGSFADDIGLQEGDAIISIDRQPIASPADVTKLQSTLKPGQAVAFHVVRSITMGGRHTPPARYYLSGRLPVD